jgi:hypothetical protein
MSFTDTLLSYIKRRIDENCRGNVGLRVIVASVGEVRFGLRAIYLSTL